MNLEEFIQRLERETDYNVNCGFNYVFAISVSEAKDLIDILRKVQKPESSY